MFSCFVKFCPFFWLHGFLFLFVLYCVLFCSYFSNVLCNPLQPPLSQHRVFCCCFLLSVFPWSFCLVWFILCCFLDQLYEGGSVWTFGLSVLPFKWKCRSGYTPFLDRPKCSLKEPKARIPFNEFSVSIGPGGYMPQDFPNCHCEFHVVFFIKSHHLHTAPNGLPAVSS